MKISDICRCCLSDVCYKDMSHEYDCGEHKEIYGRMLTDTFNVTVSYQPTYRQLICEACIVKLRDSAAFKKQVLHAENVILGKVKLEKDLDSNITLKTELDQNNLFDDFDDKISDDEMGDECPWKDDGHTASDDSEGQIFVIKIEPKEEITKNKTNFISKKIPSSITKSKRTTQEKNIDKKNILNKKLSKNLSAKPKSIKASTKKDKTSVPTSQYQLNLRDNTIKLISNSNMCLFESLKTKFGCCTCKEKFFTIQELREHSKTHSNNKGVVWKIKRLRGLTYKNVDITNLSCKLCTEPCVDINELKNHLVTKHDVEFNNSEHLLIPYKLENDYKCVLCDEKFNTYMRLSIHMNRHFANNVCDICGLSYINRISLRTHMTSLHREKRCSLCPATFQTNNSRVKHMRTSHNLGKSKRYCLKCGKTFRYSYLLFEHQVKEHGAKRQVVNCHECGKTFFSPQNLKTHVRSVHLKERNYPCSICEMRFFTKFDQKRHERTHEDSRSFSCNYCEAKFKTKDSWRRHCRRQHSVSLEDSLIK